jgi:hypothetical protein
VETLKKKRNKAELSVTIVGCEHHGHLVTKGDMQFFRHDPNTLTKNCVHESLEHLRLKFDIIKYCRSLGWEAEPEANKFGGLWRPDVLAWIGEKRIVFEVQLSPIPLEILKDRDKIRKESHIDTYWILRKFPYGTNEYIKDASVMKDFFEPSLFEEMVFFISDGIQAIKKTPDFNLERKVSSVLNGEYKQILHKSVEQFKNYNTIEKRMKSARDQLEILKSRLIIHGFANLKIPSRIKKINDMPQFDKKIETINLVWDAFENLQRDIDRLELKINDLSPNTDDSKIDDIYKTLDTAKRDEQAYITHAKYYKQIHAEETDIERENFQRVLDFLSGRE